MLQRNCSLVVYLAALKTQSLSHIRIIKKDLRGFLGQRIFLVGKLSFKRIA